MRIFIKWHKKEKGVTKLNQFSPKEGLAISQTSNLHQGTIWWNSLIALQENIMEPERLL